MAAGNTSEFDEARSLLGVSSSSSTSDVRSAFRRLLAAHHPDVHAAGDTRDRIDIRGDRVAPLEDGSLGPSSVMATEQTRKIIEAYRLLTSLGLDNSSNGQVQDEPIPHGPDLQARTEPLPPPDDRSDLVRKVDGDTLALVVPADEAYVRLLDVGHLIGDITYVDRQNGLFESLLTTVAGDAVSLVCTLQGRSDETTEAFFTMEPIGLAHGELPEIGGVIDLIAHHLIERWAM
jgi:hypothetical protein